MKKGDEVDRLCDGKKKSGFAAVMGEDDSDEGTSSHLNISSYLEVRLAPSLRFFW